MKNTLFLCSTLYNQFVAALLDGKVFERTVCQHYSIPDAVVTPLQYLQQSRDVSGGLDKNSLG
jgi:hypothetical protein